MDFTTLLQHFRIQDFFDILLITFMIYGLLVWFRDAASRFVLVGIGILGIIYYLARAFQLYLSAAVLQGFFAIILLALVIIFQEELRRFFERIATWGRFRKSDHVSTLHAEVEIIVQAVANLARQHMGALIVIQGEDPLDRHLAGGYPLDGVLSQPLLESIFDPHSIGHDGAVVIHHGRLVSFGCHLPLSTNVERIGNLGLRHTAALGLSERTDATCIVVSEERGSISVAFGGRIDLLKSPTELSMILERLYGKKMPKGPSGHILGWFRRNPLEKATAILLASLLWVAFGYQKDLVRRDVTLPIEYRNLSPQWVIEGTKITEAKVTLSGPEQAFNLLNPASLRLSVDLSGVREGRQEIELTNDMIKTPANVSVVSVTPSRIVVNASRLRSMVLPVDVRTEGALPAGIALQRIDVKPTHVTVLVPKRFAGTDLQIPTEPIDLRKVTTSTTLSAKLITPPDVSFEGGKPLSVEVTLRLRSKTAPTKSAGE
ncbi:MAG TPA: diadenylate cyclase [Syntrophales bacterium]|nr:diadenylate cyclase [Syntrophales bacterium]